MRVKNVTELEACSLTMTTWPLDALLAVKP